MMKKIFLVSVAVLVFAVAGSPQDQTRETQGSDSSETLVESSDASSGQVSQPGVLETTKKVVDILAGVATMLAIAVAGSWTWKRFIRDRANWPKANIEHSVYSRSLSETNILVHVGVTIHNIGNVRLRLSDGNIRLQRIWPCKQEQMALIRRNSGGESPSQKEADWELLSKIDFTSLNLELEPGEKDTSHFDFVLQTKLETVVVYSRFNNRRKAKAEIGWNHTTIHEIE